MNPPCSGCGQITHAVEWSVEFERRLCCACYLRMAEARARDPWPFYREMPNPDDAARGAA